MRSLAVYLQGDQLDMAVFFSSTSDECTRVKKRTLITFYEVLEKHDHV